MVLFFSFPCRSAANNLPLRHRGSFSDKAGFLPWSIFLPPFQFLCFAYPMYHPASYFSFADMGKHTVFPPIFVFFIVSLQSLSSRSCLSVSFISGSLDAGSLHGKTSYGQDFPFLSDSCLITRWRQHPVFPPALRKSQ